MDSPSQSQDSASRTPTPLDALAEQWLDEMVEQQPELRVHLGRDGDQTAYADHSPDGHAAAADAARAMLRRVEAVEPADAIDRVTRSELLRTIGDEVQMHDAGFWQRDLNVIASPAQGLRDILDLMPTSSADDWADVARRMSALPDAMDGYIASLRAGAAAGDAPSLRQVREVGAQAAKLARPDGFFGHMGDRASGQSAGVTVDLDAGARAAGKAYETLARFLSDELADQASTTDALGRDRYAVASRSFVGTEIDLDETYAWGVEELARMVAEQESIAEQILSSAGARGSGVAAAIAHLESDPSRRLHGTDALQAWMQETSDRAVEDLGRSHFDVPDIMRRLECRIAPTQEGGIYYTPPSDDFSRPGRMWWSVPEDVTEFDTWRELTTVYHEGIPGHHLQCGLAVHNAAELNGWRRMSWNSGHGEGWALYAERLMADLGYLDDPADRLGMLDGQRMRAARVVLDIGVHLGLPKPDDSGPWTDDDAYPFLAQHVAMNDPFIRFEANRYLGWGGQAPSYKVGQRLWEQLRDDWVAANGSDLKAFHRQALAVGSVGLGTLRDALLPVP
ncbi:DUF885 domain-containing protein [Aeromicrobium sp. CF3.5]|uniref:DUF885 domain-containing protein n=1 Tax=Aeromicrobium sp. CF3.5 TaxID=3373078 RepID=UPI003EE78DDC